MPEKPLRTTAPQPRIDVAIIGDVVPAVGQLGRVEGTQPHRVHTELGEVADAGEPDAPGHRLVQGGVPLQAAQAERDVAGVGEGAPHPAEGLGRGAAPEPVALQEQDVDAGARELVGGGEPHDATTDHDHLGRRRRRSLPEGFHGATVHPTSHQAPSTVPGVVRQEV